MKNTDLLDSLQAALPQWLSSLEDPEVRRMALIAALLDSATPDERTRIISYCRDLLPMSNSSAQEQKAQHAKTRSLWLETRRNRRKAATQPKVDSHPEQL